MNINQLMKQAESMKKKMEIMQEEIAEREYNGSAGGGLVKIISKGNGTILQCSIDASILRPEEKETLEDLIVVAHNEAKSKIDEDSKNSMNAALESSNLPNGLKLPF